MVADLILVSNNSTPWVSEDSYFRTFFLLLLIVQDALAYLTQHCEYILDIY